ncbi:hypothetical protein [Candidatus Soleaferrea massiliensis]|uniref:hypothetical protein n=1 Tax=Candidatus Soleaferrea massiliensis TaxID=1470354 RepID=UPI0012DFFB42|nr:hypothetical protein [Candidatus Soleaferrea massiliensis]
MTDGQFRQLNGPYLAEQETLKDQSAELEEDPAGQRYELDNTRNFPAVVDHRIEVPELIL